MSVHTKTCLRCGTSLHSDRAHPGAVDCPKCGAHYRVHRHEPKHAHAEPSAPAAPESESNGQAAPRLGILVTEKETREPAGSEPAASEPAIGEPAIGESAGIAPVALHADLSRPVRRRMSAWIGLGIALLLCAGLGLAAPLFVHMASDDHANKHADPKHAGAHADKTPKEKHPPLLTAIKGKGTQPDKKKTDPEVVSVASWRAKAKGEKPAEPAPKFDIRTIYQIDAATGPEGANRTGAGRIDELVLAKLLEKNIQPAPLCSDGVFLRRVHLDVIGTLPTAQEAKAFLKDPNPKKRELLIDQLLERPEFADYWAMRWGDILRVKSEFPINLWPNAVRTYHHWIKSSLRENMPYDQFVRAMLTSSGSNFRVPPVNFYRAVQKKDPPTTARAVGLTFMGVRPEGLSSEQWGGMEVFFSQIGYKITREWKEEIVFFDERKTLRTADAVFPDGTKATLAPGQDPRVVFADWLLDAKNPWFAKNIANRSWAWLFGRGIVHEPDDVRTDNPPSNPELLAYLESELRESKYDLKHLFRRILNSNTYQSSCIPASDRAEAGALFAFYPVRRLDAEILIDAICQISGTTEHYYSPIPEPFTFLPHGHRAISLPDASISSSFLEMFGRPSRDTGLDSERSNTFTAGQRLHLLNSAHIQKKIEKGPLLAGLIANSKRRRDTVEELFLMILSRYPTNEEVAESEIPSLTDIAWALINNEEFLCRH